MLDDVNTTETRLATIPADVDFKPDGPQRHDPQTDAVFWPDGRSWAYRASVGREAFLVTPEKRIGGRDLWWKVVPVAR